MKKLKIEFNEYATNCSDGCCLNYGTAVVVNGIKLPFHNQDVETIVDQILKHLGYEVAITTKYTDNRT